MCSEFLLVSGVVDGAGGGVCKEEKDYGFLWLKPFLGFLLLCRGSLRQY